MGLCTPAATVWKKLTLRLTYLDLETHTPTEFGGRFTRRDLAAVFEQATSIYLEWVGERRRWLRRRDESIETLAFPFPTYRPGQRKLAVGAYRVLASGGRLFLEAPTGIGKTISVLFPALKALGQGKLERIFYLTARTVGRTVAEKAFNDLRQAGARLRTLTLTARDKICFQAGQACDPAACPFARGYYDRHKPAMRAALEREEVSRPVLEAISRQHQVCPFELSLDLSAWVNAVICDYNYVFDPKVYLRRHFGEEPGDYAFLVDEAHNLVERAREMFSADLDLGQVLEVRRAVQPALPRCARALSRLGTALRRLCETPAAAAPKPRRMERTSGRQGCLPYGWDLPPKPARASPAGSFPPTCCRWSRPLSKQPRPGWHRISRPNSANRLLELFFRLHSFQRTAALYDERYVTLCQPGPCRLGAGQVQAIRLKAGAMAASGCSAWTRPDCSGRPWPGERRPCSSPRPSRRLPTTATCWAARAGTLSCSWPRLFLRKTWPS